MRQRLGLPDHDTVKTGGETVSLMKAAERLGICVGSAKTLALRRILPATQVMPGSPWLVPVDALTSEAVRIGVQRISDRRPAVYKRYQYDKAIRLPGTARTIAADRAARCRAEPDRKGRVGVAHATRKCALVHNISQAWGSNPPAWSIFKGWGTPRDRDQISG